MKWRLLAFNALAGLSLANAAEPPAPGQHWAFVKPSRPAIPQVRNAAWPRNAIDYFVLARLEKERIAPSPEADLVTLIRRLHLDLTGLPPAPDRLKAELRTFGVPPLGGPGSEDLIERLLASPHYGERWGRWWLDAARYADSNGYSIDAPRSIWKYRDWVINAFNRDLPFDQFTIEQIAGDLLPNATLDRKSTRLNSSHSQISYAVFCLKKKKKNKQFHLNSRSL